MATPLFYVLTAATLAFALMVVLARNPVHSVLYLILTFFTLSGHYILLNAQFVAAVNIIVYAGAIMVLFLFTIMFLSMNAETEQHKSGLAQVAAAVAGGMLLVILVGVLHRADQQGAIGGYDLTTFNSQVGMVRNLGQVLYRDYLLPFELASVLFLSAMVGAVMLGKREAGERNF